MTVTAFPATLDLSTLDGTNGFVLNGIDSYDYSGFAVSQAGDINGDGISDIIIGARNGDPESTTNAGESYVVFGNSTFGTSFELSSLDGTNGFVINGIDTDDYSGFVVSGAGDINGDGVDDLLIGANGADPNSNSDAGEGYVVFGSTTAFSTNFDLSDLDGTNGFVLNGIHADDDAGVAVSSAGDVNGDGVDDLIIGALFADPHAATDAGESYVVFGHSTGFNTELDLSSLNGTNGFVINGIDDDDVSGFSVSGLGDLNGDGFDDVIIGALRGDPNGNTDAGESYVVFGGSTAFSTGLDLSDLDGTNGFVINGVAAGDYAGAAVSRAGDVNGDGVEDIIIGAPHADPNGETDAGESYLIFGNSLGFGTGLDLSSLNGTNGFVFNGIDADGNAGVVVNAAGDINNDGIDDLIVGAPGAAANEAEFAGVSYVVFGGSFAGVGATLDLSDLDGANGFALNGVNSYDQSGSSVSSAGDINGDGIDDVVIGAYRATVHSHDYAGVSYVVFGRSRLPTSGNDILVGTAGEDTIDGLAGDDIINGLAGDDTLVGNAGNDIINGSDGSDTLNGGAGNDTLFGNNDDDIIRGDGGDDIILGDDGEDDIRGGAGDDDINGGNGDDVANGGNGDDILNGGDGNDILDGVNGRDIISGDGGDDVVRGGDGRDILSGGEGNDNIVGGNTKDFLFGDNGDDRIDGNGGFDQLTGGEGNDVLRGQAGDDQLIGVAPTAVEAGTGERDRLLGGLGADAFILGNLTTVFYLGNGNSDYANVLDFDTAEGDAIQLKGSSDDYSLQTFGGGTRIFADDGTTTDLVGLVKGVSLADFSSGFIFV